MSNVESVNKTFQEFHDLLQASFPKLACLRCGYETHYLMPEVAGLPKLPAITIVCARCGHIEMLHPEVLRAASKPIPTEKAALALADQPSKAADLDPKSEPDG